MIMFWLLAALMIAAVLLWILPPLLRPSPSGEKPDPSAHGIDENERINLALYQERIEELDRERREGKIDKERYETLREDIENGLIADLGLADDPSRAKAARETARPTRSGARESDAPSPPPAPGSPDSTSRYLMPVVLGLVIPIFSVALYLQFGSLRAIDPGRDSLAGVPASGIGALSAEERSDLEMMANTLEAELESDPDDAESWILLGQARMDLDDPGAAIRAFERAHAIQGDDPSLLSDWAQAEIQLSNSPAFPKSAIARIERALEIDPDHRGALWIGGFAAFQQGQEEQALARWERLQALLPEQSQEGQMLFEWLTRVRAGALADQGEPEGDSEASAGSSKPDIEREESAPKIDDEDGTEGGSEKADSSVEAVDRKAARTDPLAPRIEVEVDIEAELAKGLGGDETIFVFARPAPNASGESPAPSGPPLAIVRTTLAALPTSVVLDESSAMIAGRGLSSASTVIVSARLSRTGRAERAGGDIEGSFGPVPTVGGEPIRILLSRVVP